jgi:outer membrane lipoprotein carrier protein
VKRLTLALVAFAAFVQAAEPANGPLLKQIEARYNRSQALQVQFSETYSGGGRSKTESGMLYLRKPGRMRWEYSNPVGKLFISDGNSVFLYLPDSNRVEKMKLKETEDMRAPLAFLLGKLNFEKEFQKIQVQTTDAGTTITAEPKSPTLPYSTVEFFVSSNLEIRRLQVTGQDRSLLNFTFAEERLNAPLDDKLFRFIAPHGAEVVEAGQ